MKLPPSETATRLAAIAALVALPFMVWSIFDPRVWAILIGLTVGQGIGTLALGLFFLVVARDLRLRSRLSSKEDRVI